MPCIPEHSLLRIEMPDFHSHGNIELGEFYRLWSTISKSSCAIQNGRRYENMAWRLMNSAAFCRPEAAKPDLDSSYTPFAPHVSTSAKSSPSMPALSDSEDSSADEAQSQLRATRTSRPDLRRLDSNESCRSRRGEPCIALTSLEKMVTTIQETNLEPIDIPALAPTSRADDASTSVPVKQTPKMAPSSMTSSQCSENTNGHVFSSQATINTSSPSTIATKGSSMIDSTSQLRSASQESSTSEGSTHSIIRGFVPGGAPSSYRSQTRLHAQPTPILKSASQHQLQPPQKKGAMFTLGSSSAEEEESSLESNMGKPSVSQCMKRTNGLVDVKKQTSFKEEVAVQTSRDSPVFDSDDEDEISESAIEDDDDSSDWEDSDDASEENSHPPRDLFQRVDSHPNLASRRSLLTSALHAPDRARAFEEAASRSTPALRRSRTSTPNGPSLATSPNGRAPVPGPIESTHAGARPIEMSQSQYQMATSPRTTRRTMLQSEMTDSLRRNLLWERQHKVTGHVGGALPRRHTSNDVKNLKQHPEPGPVFSPNSTMQYNNDVFNTNLNDIHTKGW